MAQGKVLVTGGSGFLGINLIRLLHEKGYGLVSLDLVPFDYADMMPHVTGIVGDIRFGQMLIRDVMLPVLKDLRYDDIGLADRWWPLGKRKLP